MWHWGHTVVNCKGNFWTELQSCSRALIFCPIFCQIIPRPGERLWAWCRHQVLVLSSASQRTAQRSTVKAALSSGTSWSWFRYWLHCLCRSHGKSTSPKPQWANWRTPLDGVIGKIHPDTPREMPDTQGGPASGKGQWSMHAHLPSVFALHLLEPIAKTAAKPCSFSWEGFSVDPSSLRFWSK